MGSKRTASLSKSLLAGELSDNPDEFDAPDTVPDAEPTSAPPEPVATPVPESVPELAPPAPPATPENALIMQLVAALAANSRESAQAIKDALGQATTMAREQIPENKVSPGFSVYAHEDGDQKHPRTVLRCPMFLGVYDEDGKVSPAFEYFPETLTEEERLGLNALKPGARPNMRRHDGAKALIRVAETMDSNGGTTRLVVAVPESWLGQDQFHQMPTLVDMLQQLLRAQLPVAA